MSIDKINRQHVLDAVKKITEENKPLHPSTGYDVIIDGKPYPPKEVMRYANLIANGIYDWSYGGGEATNRHLRDLGFDIQAKGTIPTAALTSTPLPLTGHIWKLGSNWGRGMPVFYDFLREHSIVIGVEAKRYSPGDLILITRGYTVCALGKVLETPVPVTEQPAFGEPFDQYSIDYGSWVVYAKVQWLELGPAQQFTYQLQQGICRVQSASVRHAALTLWNDQEISYYLYSCSSAALTEAINGDQLLPLTQHNISGNWICNKKMDKLLSCLF